MQRQLPDFMQLSIQANDALHSSNPERAFRLMDMAILLAEEQGENGYADSFRTLKEMMKSHLTQDYQGVIERYQTSFSSCQAQGDTLGQLDALIGSAEASHWNNDNASALNYLRQAENILGAITPDDHERIINRVRNGISLSLSAEALLNFRAANIRRIKNYLQSLSQ